MKGFIASITLFFCIIIGLLVYSHYMNVTFTDLIDRLDQIEESLKSGDMTKSRELSSAFEEDLKKKTHRLSPLCDRALLENALSVSAQLTSFVHSGNISEASAVLSSLRSLLLSIGDKSKASLSNII